MDDICDLVIVPVMGWMIVYLRGSVGTRLSAVCASDGIISMHVLERKSEGQMTLGVVGVKRKSARDSGCSNKSSFTVLRSFSKSELIVVLSFVGTEAKEAD